MKSCTSSSQLLVNRAAEFPLSAPHSPIRIRARAPHHWSMLRLFTLTRQHPASRADCPCTFLVLTQTCARRHQPLRNRVACLEIRAALVRRSFLPATDTGSMSDRRHDRGAFADHPPRRETARPSARRQSAPNLMQEEWSDGPRKTHQLVQDLATLVPILASTPTEAGEATRIQVTNLTLHVTTAGRDLQLLDTTQRRAISDASDAWLKAHSDSSDCAGLNHDHQQLRTTSEVRTTKTTKLFPTYYQKPSSSLTNNNYIDRKLFPPDMNIRANREAALGTIIRLSLPALDQFGQEIADQDFKESVKSMGVEKMEEVYAYSKVNECAYFFSFWEY